MTNTSAQVGAYVGDGGIVIHLDQAKSGVPADPLMAKQFAKGTLRLATDAEAETEGVVHGKPSSNALVGVWRDWAISNGLPKYEAEGMSKKALMLWADSDVSDLDGGDE